MRFRPKHFILTIASVGLGVGLGVEALMNREVAGPVLFVMSGFRRIREEKGHTAGKDACRLLAWFLPLQMCRVIAIVGVEWNNQTK